MVQDHGQLRKSHDYDVIEALRPLIRRKKTCRRYPTDALTAASLHPSVSVKLGCRTGKYVNTVLPEANSPCAPVSDLRTRNNTGGNTEISATEAKRQRKQKPGAKQ